MDDKGKDSGTVVVTDRATGKKRGVTIVDVNFRYGTYGIPYKEYTVRYADGTTEKVCNGCGDMKKTINR